MNARVSLLLLFVAACGDDPAADGGDAGDTVEPEVEEIAPDVEDVDPDEEADAPEPLTLGEPVPSGRVIAGVATRQEHLVAGPKAEGQLGDLVMANQRATFVIEGARRAGGYRMWGGHLVDVVIDGLPDRFGELWWGWNLEVFVPEEAVVISDGADGVAHVRVTGRTGPYPWVDSFLRVFLNPAPADLTATYDYRLEPDAPRLELTITLSNHGTAEVDLEFPLMAMNMGDGAKSFAPGLGFETVPMAFGISWLGAVGPEASYALGTRETLTGIFSYSAIDILTLDPTRIGPGEELRYEMAYVASTDGTPGLVTEIDRWLGVPTTEVAIEGGVDGPSDGAWVVVTDAESSFRVGGLVLVKDGRYRVEVPAGRWSVQAWAPGIGGSEPVVVEASAGDVDLVLPEPATLSVTIRDATSGDPIPGQLSVFREPGTDSPFAPAAVRLDVDPRSGRTAMIFAVHPETTAQVPAGRYRAVASRGYSYELAEEVLDLEPGERRVVDLAIERAVDTGGWLAADFHLHAQWSSDSDVPYDTRVRQAAANGVTLPVLTEHANIGDLLPAAELAGVGDYVTAIPAQEVTTFEYGHFNAFPLVYDPSAPSGGAVFEHGHEGAALFDAMRAQQPDQVLIQVNHPRSTSRSFFAYFGYLGFDAKTGTAAFPERLTDNWDLLEVFNGECVGDPQNDAALLDWFDLTNLGWRKTLSSGSDSHRLSSGVGHPRNWIALEPAAVALDPQAIVEPLMARKTFVSCGPFVRFSASDGAGMGEMTGVDGDGEVAFSVIVEAPTWIAVDAVNLLENGVVIASVTLEDPHGGPDPERPALRFDGVLTATPERDSWYAVEVVGSGSLSPVELGDVPYAMTNPIEVDRDGDGVWTPPGNDGL